VRFADVPSLARAGEERIRLLERVVLFLVFSSHPDNGAYIFWGLVFGRAAGSQLAELPRTEVRRSFFSTVFSFCFVRAFAALLAHRC